MSRQFYPLVALAVFGSLLICGAAVMAIPSVARKANSAAVGAKLPDAEGWYLGYYNGGHDHVTMYLNLDDAAEALRSADVLLLGNSRMLYAMDSEEIQAFERRTNLRCYVLAFAYSEMCEFPQKLIERYDLHPKWVVINADPFFVKETSKMAKKAMTMTPWEARKAMFEAQVGLAVHRQMDSWLPHLFEQNPAWVYFRSYRDGSIFVSSTKGKPSLAESNPISWEITAELIQTFEEFQKNMKSRGVGTALTTIPPTVAAPMTELAEKSHTPHFYSKVVQLKTSDGSHLNPESAKRFSESFFRDLERIVNSD